MAQARGVLGRLPVAAGLFHFPLFSPHNIKFIYKHITGFVQYMYSLCRTCTCFARTHETTSCPNKSYFMGFSFIATTCQFWWLVWLCCFLDQFMQVELLVQVPVLCCHSNYNLPAHRTSFHEIKYVGNIMITGQARHLSPTNLHYLLTACRKYRTDLK